jgi:hypothetical protein
VTTSLKKWPLDGSAHRKETHKSCWFPRTVRFVGLIKLILFKNLLHISASKGTPYPSWRVQVSYSCTVCSWSPELSTAVKNLHPLSQSQVWSPLPLSFSLLYLTPVRNENVTNSKDIADSRLIVSYKVYLPPPPIPQFKGNVQRVLTVVECYTIL